MKYSLLKLLALLASGEGLVLAKVVETESSTPQVPGASAVFSAKGLEAGTVGGGVLEARVEAAAGQALKDGKSRLLSIRLDAEPSDKEGGICGGTARVLVDPGVGRDAAVFAAVLKILREKVHGQLVTGMEPLEQDIVAVKRVWLPFIEREAFRDRTGGLPAGFMDTKDGYERTFEEDLGRFVFTENIAPLPSLIIAGAGHVGRAVAHLGALLDFHVTVIDDRADLANAENIPDADEIIVGDIGRSLGRIVDSNDNYYVIVTRGHDHDAEALRACLYRPADYIGMIGSQKKVEVMRREFLEKGWAREDEWARIHSPIGLEIGSKTVEEIAVSIAAELVLVRSSIREKYGQP